MCIFIGSTQILNIGIYVFNLSFQAKETPWIPNVILGIISFSVALITLLLPETKDWPLPQTIEDVHLFSKGSEAGTTVSTASFTEDRVRRRSSVYRPVFVENRETAI